MNDPGRRQHITLDFTEEELSVTFEMMGHAGDEYLRNDQVEAFESASEKIARALRGPEGAG